MKFFAVVFFLCFASALATVIRNNDHMKEMDYREDCIMESGVDRAALDRPLRDDESEENIEKLGCFMGCVLKKSGIINPDNTFNEELVRSEATNNNKEQGNELINKWKGIFNGTDLCKAGARAIKSAKELRRKSPYFTTQPPAPSSFD